MSGVALDRRCVGWLSLVLAGGIAAATPAYAESAPPRRLGTIEVEASRDADEPDPADAPSFVTIIPVERASARVVSVADLVQREAGIRVRSAGGLGSFTSVSMRGSDAAEVAVYLDGVPLNRASSSVVDLSQIPADGLERVEIYRGLAPPELGGQSVGGAINLVTRKGARAPAFRFSVGGGSFATRSLSAGYGFGGPSLRADASLAYRGSRGDFVYYDDNGTLLTAADDRPGIRRNNDFDQLAGDVSIGAGRSTRLSLGVHGFVKDQGVPGRASTEGAAPTARLGTARLLADAAVERAAWPTRSLDVRLAGHVLFQRTAFDNLAGDAVGGGRAERFDAQNLELGLDARARAATGAFGLWTLFASASDERYLPFDLLHGAAVPGSDRRRASLTVADDVRLRSDRVALTPSLRIERIENHLAPGFSVFAYQAAGSDQTDGYLSPDLGVRVRLLPWLRFKGSVGRSVRVPTTVELFGDGAFILARPALRPETAFGGDAGLLADAARGPFAVLLEAAFFGRAVTDFIGLRRTANAASYDNLGDQRFLGAEGRGRLRAGPLSVSCDYTFIHDTGIHDTGIHDAGASLVPGVPSHKLDVRGEIARGPFSLHYDVSWVSDVFLTEQGGDGSVIPGRVLHALGARAGPFPRLPLTLTVEIDNLTDLRVVDFPLGGSANAGRVRPGPLTDFMDYPLPGRAVYVTLAWQR